MKTFFGIILAVLLSAAAVISLAYLRFQQIIERDAREMFAAAWRKPGAVVTQAMLQDLPEPVQRYLRYSGVVGKPIASTVRLKQVGKIRLALDKPWMAVTADEYYTVDSPGLVWNATIQIAGLPAMRGYDLYRNAQGRMRGKIAALFPIFDEQGEELTQGAMLRYLNEMVWFPSAFLGDNIHWTARDENSAQATFTDGGKSVTAVLYFDDTGRLTNFIARRYRSTDDGYSLETWSTPMDEYGEFEGLRLPISGRAVWNLPEGDLEYIQLEITALEYDRPELYR